MHHDKAASPTEQLQEHHHQRRWVVVFSAALFFFYEFIQMHMFNTISGDLMSAFKVSATSLGSLSATYLYADVLFLLPAGIILDRVSTKLVISCAMVLCILGTGLFALAHNFWLAAACHFMAGIGNAFCFLSCIRLASRWFPSKTLAMIIGLIVTFAMAGGLVAQTPLTLLNETVGWRTALMMNAGLGLLILILILAVVKDYPAGYQHQYERQKQQLASIGFWSSIGLALNNLQNWLAGIYTSLLNLPIMLLGALWGDMYLTQVAKLSQVQASNVVSMIFVGTIIGGPVIGAWSDRISLRKLPMITGAVFSIMVMLGVLIVKNIGYGPLMAMFFLLGFFTSSQVLAYPVITESNNRIVTSTATALASILIMGGAAFFQLLFGMIMDAHWEGALVNGIRTYPIDAYDSAMLIFPITFVIALVAAFLVRETHCREVNTHHQHTL